MYTDPGSAADRKGQPVNQIDMVLEVPVSDPVRASRFYRRVFGSRVDIEISNSLLKVRLRPVQSPPPEALPSCYGGLLACIPGFDGIHTMHSRIREAGGEVILPRTLLARGLGYVSVFRDSEGNRLALTSS